MKTEVIQRYGVSIEKQIDLVRKVGWLGSDEYWNFKLSLKNKKTISSLALRLKKYRESQNKIPKRSSKYDYQLAQFVNWKTRIIYFSTKKWYYVINSRPKLAIFISIFSI